MIKTPEIPTDNLYKFIAIFGLIIFIYSIYLFVDNQKEFEESLKIRSQKNNIEIFEESKTESKKIILNEKIRYLTTKIRLCHGISNTYFITDSQFVNIKNIVEFEKDFYALNKLKHEDLLIGDSSFHHDLNRKYSDDIVKHYSVTPIFTLGIFGMILIILGFSLWYERTQKYFDLELKYTSKKETKLQ